MSKNTKKEIGTPQVAKEVNRLPKTITSKLTGQRLDAQTLSILRKHGIDSEKLNQHLDELTLEKFWSELESDIDNSLLTDFISDLLVCYFNEKNITLPTFHYYNEKEVFEHILASKLRFKIGEEYIRLKNDNLDSFGEEENI